MGDMRRDRGENTRAAILLAAEAVFAEHGFDGARIDVIAKASGYNKALIFRYFGDKLGLYTATLKRSDQEFGSLLAHVFAPLLTDEDAASDARRFRPFLAAMVRVLFDYLLEHPRLIRILTWEMAASWKTFMQIASQFPPETSDQFRMLFHKAWSAGLLRSDFVPLIQLTTILQCCQSLITFLPLYQAVLPDEDLTSAHAFERAQEYMVNFIVAGMMSDPHGGDA